MIDRESTLASRSAGFAAMALIACALACGAPDRERVEEQTGLHRRVLLVAVDGLDWGVVLPLVREGRMPEIERLMEDGAYGLLRTSTSTVAPSLWTTIATGKSPEKHGILGLVRWNPIEPDETRPYEGTDRRVKAFWNILDDYGLRVGVVGWPVTFPVEDIDGVMVALEEGNGPAEWDDGDLQGGPLALDRAGQVQPPARQDEMIGIVESVRTALPLLFRETLGIDEGQGSEQGRSLLDASRGTFAMDAASATIGRHLCVESPPFDLVAVHLGGADVVGHRFWRYFAPDLFSHEPDRMDVETFGGVIPAYYAFVDRTIGRLRRAAAGSLTVVVLSDHGMSPANTSAPFPAHARGAELRSAHHSHGPDGVWIAGGPGVRSGDAPARPREVDRSQLKVVGSVLDVTPTLLVLLGVPVGADMDGRIMRSVVDRGLLETEATEPVASHDSSDWRAGREAPSSLAVPNRSGGMPPDAGVSD